MVEGMEQLPYVERLQRLGLLSFGNRGVRGYIIEVFRIMPGEEKVDKYFRQHIIRLWNLATSLEGLDKCMEDNATSGN